MIIPLLSHDYPINIPLISHYFPMNIPLIDDHEKKPLENQGPVAPTDGGMAWMCGAQQFLVLGCFKILAYEMEVYRWENHQTLVYRFPICDFPIDHLTMAVSMGKSSKNCGFNGKVIELNAGLSWTFYFVYELSG
jgi:hypothetical protein